MNEKIAAEAPASIAVLDKLTLQQTPGVNIDDRLRAVPGFTLFRRSSSTVANPTTQGVSLRGLGSSGASRTLVLWDGVPANDAFGGWVYWTRFAPDELERIEVSRGASTSIFGDRAMSGAIALFTRAPERTRLNAGYEGGNRNTHQVTTGFSQLAANWAFGVSARAATTDGYFIVPEYRRGPADAMAANRFVAGGVRADWFSGRHRLFLKADILAEERKNGTVLTNNSTSFGAVSGHYSRDFGNDSVSLLGYHTREMFRASFTAVTADRKRETVSYFQTVPSESYGGAAMWRHTVASKWNLVAGADMTRVDGFSADYLFPTVNRVGGGRQLQSGVFAQTDYKLGPVKLFAGLRAHNEERQGEFWNPSAGFAVGKQSWRGRGSVYRSFRAPTLNELFREFRQGNTITQANPALRAESVFGAEIGVDYVGETSRAGITFYRGDLSNLITNVTLVSTPAQIVRQRRNAFSALARGVEFDYRKRFLRHLHADFGYLFADSRFSTGERIPQTPRHQGSANLTYQYNKTFISGGLRTLGAQFEDERNQFLLPGFATLSFVARQRLTPQFSASASFENLLNREYLVGFSPIPLIGAPRLWRVGLQWEGRLAK